MAQNPTYLTKNRLGVFIFQFRNPISIVNQCTNVKALFRVSLSTRDYRVALSAARYWRVKMQNLIEKYFDDPESYGKAQALLMKLRKADNRGGYGEVEPLLAELEEADNYLLERIFEYEAEVESVCKAERNEQLIARYEQYKASNINSSEQKPKLKLTEVIEKFIEDKRRNCDPKTADSMEHKEYRPKLSLFVEVVGDKLCGDIIKHDVAEFKDMLFKFPKNRHQNTKCKGLSIAEIKELGLCEDERISNTTIKNYATKVGIFITWGVDNGYFVDGLKSPLKKIVKKTQRDDEERDPFNANDLKKIFESKQYIEGKHKNAAHFWVPLLGLFTGARVNELCQLYVDDVYQDENIWCFDINSKQDKKLKNLNSKRIVPIHSTLIDMGFIDFVTRLKENEVKRLFMDLQKTNEGYATGFSKWFNRTYLNERNCNVGHGDKENKNFHSFRHTFINFYKQLGDVNMTLVSELVGQKSGDTVTNTRYGKPLRLDKKSELIEKLTFEEVQFNLISRASDNV